MSNITCNYALFTPTGITKVDCLMSLFSDIYDPNPETAAHKRKVAGIPTTVNTTFTVPTISGMIQTLTMGTIFLQLHDTICRGLFESFKHRLLAVDPAVAMQEIEEDHKSLFNYAAHAARVVDTLSADREEDHVAVETCIHMPEFVPVNLDQSVWMDPRMLQRIVREINNFTAARSMLVATTASYLNSFDFSTFYETRLDTISRVPCELVSWFERFVDDACDRFKKPETVSDAEKEDNGFDYTDAATK